MSEADKPADNSAADRFLSRWSRRKVAARESPHEAAAATPVPGTAVAVPTAAAISAPSADAEPADQAEKTELPSIESLTADADFSPFMAKDVDPAMRNQAMKKLFTDPHYGFDNMDKLDIYIDDYSKSDPIPLEMLKMMYQSKSLFLFDDEKEEQESTAAAPVAEAGDAVNESPLLHERGGSSATGKQANTPENIVDTSPRDSAPANVAARDGK